MNLKLIGAENGIMKLRSKNKIKFELPLTLSI